MAKTHLFEPGISGLPEQRTSLAPPENAPGGVGVELDATCWSETRDIEALLRANDALRHALQQRDTEIAEIKRRFDVTLSNVSQGIAVIDGEGRIQVHNDRWLALTGLTPDDVANHPFLHELVEKMLANGEFVANGTAYEQALRMEGCEPRTRTLDRVRPDGTVLRVQTKKLDDGGQVQMVSDISDLVKRQVEIEATHASLQQTLENVSQGIIKLDADNYIAFYNTRFKEILGIPDDAIRIGMDFMDLLEYQIHSGEFDEFPPEFVERLYGIARNRRAERYERPRKNGTIIEVCSIPLEDGGIVRTFTDVTEARRREAAIAQAEAEFRSLYENSIVGIYRSSLDGRNIRANPALVRLNGFSSEEEMVREVSDIAKDWYVDPDRRAEFVALMERDGRVTDFVSEVHRYKTRERIWITESAWVVRDKDGMPLYYEGMVIDATDRRKAETEIAHLALHDMLTGLPNRTFFLDELRSALQTRRKNEEAAVLCLDLDRFKDVNDTLGHDAGDVLLKLAARRIKRLLPRNSLAARFGGDEFAILLSSLRERESVIQLARAVVKTLSAPFRIRGKRVYVGASIGIALSPGDGEDIHDLLKKADIALYRSKQDGRGTYSFFDIAMTATLLARREIEVELRRAIANDEFELHYQPIIDLETNRPVLFEALVRWRHPQKGLLYPASFIDIAEESGLIVAIGEVVLRQACRTFAALPGNVAVSVNLSPIQFRNHQLAAVVVNVLASTGLAPTRLVLEITESVFLADDPQTINILRQLRQLGVRIALDDFGIGHSSLSYVQKFPFDKIKIDRSFIQETGDGSMNMAIRRAILGLGQDLDIEVIMEGVETEHQRDFLIYEGCRYAQGYHFGRPEPASIALAAFRPKADADDIEVPGEIARKAS